MKRETLTLPMSNIKLNEHNPRVITAQQMKRLVQSIQDFPEMTELRPIVVDENNVILGGNMRYRAMQSLGYEQTEVIKVSGLSDEQKREFIIKDNVPFGDWDWDELANSWDITELSDWGLDIDLPEERDTEITEDEPPEPEAEAQSKPGEVYQLGNHRLICGDATDETTLATLMGGQLADMLETDPPYGVDLWNLTPEEAKKQHHRTDGLKVANDNMGSAEMQEWLTKAFASIANHLKAGGAYYVWHASSTISEFYNAIGTAIAEPRQQLIWVKNRIVMGRQDYQWRHEPCLYGWKSGASHYFTDSRCEATTWEQPLELDKMNAKELRATLERILTSNEVAQDVLRYDRPNNSPLHPTMKPVKLIAQQIKNSSRRGETVLDPFGGSGTTLMACEWLGRRAYLAELDPRYCDVIRKRYWKFVNGSDDGWEQGTPAVTDIVLTEVKHVYKYKEDNNATKA